VDRFLSGNTHSPKYTNSHEITLKDRYLESNPIDSRNLKAGSLFLLKNLSGFLETIRHWHFYLNILEKQTVQRQAT